MCCSLCWKYVDLKAVNSLQELPVDLAVNVPSQTPNWDIVCDIVNLTSKTFRSARQVMLGQQKWEQRYLVHSIWVMTVHGSLSIQSQRNSWHFLPKQHAKSDQFSCQRLSFRSVIQSINQAWLLCTLDPAIIQCSKLDWCLVIRFYHDLLLI